MTRVQTLFWSLLLLIYSSSFFLKAGNDKKKVVSVVHTENLVTVLGGERPEKEASFNSYQVYTMKRKPLRTLFSSYVKVKINQKFFRVKLSELNHFLTSMSPSLEVHANFKEEEITRRFNLALHTFQRKLTEEASEKNKEEDSPISETKQEILYPKDVEITKVGENEPIRYTDFLVILGLRKNPLLLEQEARERLKLRKLEETSQKIEETKKILENLQKEIQENLKGPSQKKSPRSKKHKHTLKIKKTGSLIRI